jgi:sugar phosphate isomerase/epimerase
LDRLIDLAGAIGARFIRTFAGRLPADADGARMVETIAGALAPLARKACDNGVTIGLETHDDWCSGERVMAVIDGVGSPGFGVVYDIFNCIHTGTETWDETYARVRKHICYFHLKDGYNDAEGRNHYVMIGAGDLPVRDVLARLKADGYDGFISFEWEKMWCPELEQPERAFPQFAHKLRRLWAAA